MMKSLTRHLLILITLSATVFFTSLGTARLWDRDEPRNAGCARDMLAAGNWIVPVFNDELRVHKPILTYWFMMTSFATFDDPEFAARFWSALFGIGTTLLTYLITRRLFNPTAALWAGVILATNIMFAIVARLATPEIVLCFFCTLAMFVYVFSVFPRRTSGDWLESIDDTQTFFPKKWWQVALIYAVMGLATLAKGPIGFLLPAAVIGMFLLIVRLPSLAPVPVDVKGFKRWIEHARRLLRPFAPMHFLRTVWLMRPITLAFVVLLVALPWYVEVGRRTDGAWSRGFFVDHNVTRALKPMEGHGGGPWYYPLTILFGFFPWVVVLLPAVVSSVLWVRRRDPVHPAYLFALCWACVWVGVFTVASTKLPTYITPMYPALAILTGSYLQRWQFRDVLPDRLRTRLAFGTLAFVGAGIIVGISVAMHTIFQGGVALGAIGLVVVAGAIVCWVLSDKDQRTATLVAFSTTAGAFMLALFTVAAPVVDRYQLSHELLAAINQRGAQSAVASFGRLEPSWVFYLGRPIVEIPKDHFDDAEAFIEGGRDRFLITTADRYQQLRPNLRPDLVMLESIPYFGHKGEIVMIGSVASD